MMQEYLSMSEPNRNLHKRALSRGEQQVQPLVKKKKVEFPASPAGVTTKVPLGNLNAKARKDYISKNKK